MDSCLDFCNKFSYFKNSGFFEGDLKILQGLSNYFLDVIRQQGFVFKKDTASAEATKLEYNSNLHSLEMISLIKNEWHLAEELTLGEDSHYLTRSIVHSASPSKLLKMRILSAASRPSRKKANSFIEKMRRRLLKNRAVTFRKKKVWNPIRGEWGFQYVSVKNHRKLKKNKPRKMNQIVSAT